MTLINIADGTECRWRSEEVCRNRRSEKRVFELVGIDFGICSTTTTTTTTNTTTITIDSYVYVICRFSNLAPKNFTASYSNTELWPRRNRVASIFKAPPPANSCPLIFLSFRFVLFCFSSNVGRTMKNMERRNVSKPSFRTKKGTHVGSGGWLACWLVQRTQHNDNDDDDDM
ncbi:hypothetical protein M0804_000258 [Polistes exclamans]|nr:hypothetical protein M0804_000258 [Polistes exclamans]